MSRVSRRSFGSPTSRAGDRGGRRREVLPAVVRRAQAISSEGYRSPGDYADSFRVLEEHGLLPGDLAARLSAAVGFRSLLVHEYARIDDRRVHDFMAEGLDDFRAFAAAIYEAFLEL